MESSSIAEYEAVRFPIALEGLGGKSFLKETSLSIAAPMVVFDFTGSITVFDFTGSETDLNFSDSVGDFDSSYLSHKTKKCTVSILLIEIKCIIKYCKGRCGKNKNSFSIKIPFSFLS